MRIGPAAMRLASAVALGAILGACGGGGGSGPGGTSLVGPSAIPATAPVCAGLTRFAFADTRITSATLAAAGAVSVAGQPIAEHCVVTGTMKERQGANGSYATSFELRLPTVWNGRFFFQTNAGFDGIVVPALGIQSGGGPLATPLSMGFAVLSSDTGHNAAQNNVGPGHFGLDPQARADWGYGFIAALTPMARELVRASYGRLPERMYIGGCSSGGRQALVAAARYPDLFDGYLACAPGFNLPKNGVQIMWETQQLATAATKRLASGLPDVSTAFSAAERALVAERVVRKCDALDGAVDGMVLDVAACQGAFDVQTDVPTCTGPRDGTCLDGAQKAALTRLLGGARNSAGVPLYASFPWERGIAYDDWAIWKYALNTSVGAGMVPYLLVSPPQQVADADLLRYSLAFSMDTDAPKIFAGGGTFAESAMSYLTPPNADDLSAVRRRGGKILVFHGTADPMFSSNDTAAWYERLRAASGGDASDFARYFAVPGMGHCAGGAAADQFNAVAALQAWVEQGQAPERLIASVRGPGNLGGANALVPASWSPARSRPLCPYPQVARLVAGATDLESAASFACR